MNAKNGKKRTESNRKESKQKINKLTLKVKLFSNENRRLKRKLEKYVMLSMNVIQTLQESEVNSDLSYQTLVSSVSPSFLFIFCLLIENFG